MDLFAHPNSSTPGEPHSTVRDFILEPLNLSAVQTPAHVTLTRKVDRSDYYVQAFQLCFALKVVSWMHPINSIGASSAGLLNLYHILKTLTGKGYAWWGELELRVEEGEQFADKHSCEFVFVKLREFLDHCVDETWSLQDKLKAFYVYFIKERGECSCSACRESARIWNRKDQASKVKYCEVFNIDMRTLTRARAQMLTWDTTIPAARDHEDLRVSFWAARREGRTLLQLFDALDSEVDVLANVFQEPRLSFLKADLEYGLVPLQRPTRASVKMVTAHEGLASPHCPVCCETFTYRIIGDKDIPTHCPMKSRCNHVICLKCYETLIADSSSRNRRCPFCRLPFAPPPEHHITWAAFHTLLEDEEFSTEESVLGLVKALCKYLVGLPQAVQEKPPTLPSLSENLTTLTDMVFGSPSNAIRRASRFMQRDPNHYLHEAQLGVGFLYGMASRLENFALGDTVGYRDILEGMWPIFINYQIHNFASGIKAWSDLATAQRVLDDLAFSLEDLDLVEPQTEPLQTEPIQIEPHHTEPTQTEPPQTEPSYEPTTPSFPYREQWFYAPQYLPTEASHRSLTPSTEESDQAPTGSEQGFAEMMARQLEVFASLPHRERHIDMFTRGLVAAAENSGVEMTQSEVRERLMRVAADANRSHTQ